MRGRARWAIVVAGAVLAGCGAAEPTPAPAPGFFGVNAQLLQPLPAHGQTAELATQLDSLAGLGVDFVRTNLDWQLLEPRAPSGAGRTYDFASTDPWVAALADRGLRWQPTVQGVPTPAWARDRAAEQRCDYRSPPARPRDFAALMAVLASRYGRHGEFWRDHGELPYEPIRQYEVWNEPNYAVFWCPTPDPAAYARLYAAGRAAVHAVDPNAQVLFGLAGFKAGEVDRSTAMPADEFLRRALAEVPGLERGIDVLAVHPYDSTPALVLGKLSWLRELADAAGLEGVPLSVNEFGWYTRGRGGAPRADEDTRAAYVAEVTEAIAESSCDVVALALHTWITPEADPVDPESWYGIADPVSGALYPTADAYADRVQALRSRAPVPLGGVSEHDPCAGG